MLEQIIFTLNGERTELNIDPSVMLLDVLRDTLGLIGSKKGCGKGECGACSVLVNGRTVNSCIYPAMKAQGASIVTIEGLKGADGQLDPVQQAFIDRGAVQCGYCIPGMILSAKELLAKNTSPTPEDVREAIGGNICRCTGYVKIEEAIMAAAEVIRKEDGDV